MVHRRNKGRDGRAELVRILKDRGWEPHKSYDGIISDDLVVVDTEGKQWSCEVKNTRMIDNSPSPNSHKSQAKKQAKARGSPWMLASKIYGSRWWLIQRQGKDPELWETV